MSLKVTEILANVEADLARVREVEKAIDTVVGRLEGTTAPLEPVRSVKQFLSVERARLSGMKELDRRIRSQVDARLSLLPKCRDGAGRVALDHRVEPVEAGYRVSLATVAARAPVVLSALEFIRQYGVGVEEAIRKGLQSPSTVRPREVVPHVTRHDHGVGRVRLLSCCETLLESLLAADVTSPNTQNRWQTHVFEGHGAARFPCLRCDFGCKGKLKGVEGAAKLWEHLRTHASHPRTGIPANQSPGKARPATGTPQPPQTCPPAHEHTARPENRDAEVSRCVLYAEALARTVATNSLDQIAATWRRHVNDHRRLPALFVCLRCPDRREVGVIGLAAHFALEHVAKGSQQVPIENVHPNSLVSWLRAPRSQSEDRRSSEWTDDDAPFGGDDLRDATRYMGYPAREQCEPGRYGSHPVHDGYTDEDFS